MTGPVIDPVSGLVTRIALVLSTAALGVPFGAAAAQLPRSAPITNVHYDVTFDSAHAAARSVGVRMTFTTRGRAPVILALPAWTPGSYEIGYFARQLSQFTVTRADGRPIAWDRLDYQTWRVRPEGAGPVTVAFEVRADQFDNARSWARGDFLLFNGTNVILYPTGQSLDRYPATVRVTTAPGWRVATGMAPAQTPHTWTQASYHDLVDMPFFVGRFDLDSVQVSGRWTRLATYPAGSVAGERRQRAHDWLARVIPPEVAVFGEAPWRTYTILQIADSAYHGFSGLEHQNSQVDLVAAGQLDAAFLPALYAHEIFHAFNVKRLRPADLVPYRYAREQPTPLLWVSEGITDYYTDLAQLRGGVTDSAEFLASTMRKIATVAAAPPTALKDASLATWAPPNDGSGSLYYPKGALAGLLLDILIRDASDNHGSLDTVMRALYDRRYRRAFRGFTTVEFFAACTQAAGGGPTQRRLFGDFYKRYVNGREPYTWGTVLPLAGLRLQTDTVREARVGVSTRLDSLGAVVVTDIVAGGPAALAGVHPGDRVLGVGTVDVHDQRWSAEFRARYADRAGAELPIRVRRGTDTLVLAGRVVVVPRAIGRVVADSAASGRARRVRDGIFRGTTAPERPSGRAAERRNSTPQVGVGPADRGVTGNRGHVSPAARPPRDSRPPPGSPGPRPPRAPRPQAVPRPPLWPTGRRARRRTRCARRVGRARRTPPRRP